MRKLQYIFPFLFCLIYGLNARCQTTPAQYSAKIDKTTSKIHSLASLWGTSFLQQYNGNQQYKDLSAIRTELQEYLDDKIAEFKGMKDVGGSGQIQQSLLAFLEYERQLVEKGFGPFELLPQSASESDVARCRSNLTDEAAREKGLLSVLNKDRKEYAEKNNFPLVPPPPPKAPTKPRLRYSDLVDGELPSKDQRQARPAAAPAAPKAVPPSHREPDPGEKPKKKDKDEDDEEGDE